MKTVFVLMHETCELVMVFDTRAAVDAYGVQNTIDWFAPGEAEHGFSVHEMNVETSTVPEDYKRVTQAEQQALAAKHGTDNGR